MKKMIIASAILTLISGAAFAQAGANPSAPQPSSDGRGVNIPATTRTGTAVDRPDSNQAQEDAVMRERAVKEGVSRGMAR